MRKIILILITFIIIASVHAEGLPSVKYPKSLKSLSDISDIACDLCGCYMGLDPNYHKNIVGLRYHTFKFVTEPHNPVGDSESDHPNSGETSTEYYNAVELFGRYYFTPKLRSLLSVPFSSNNIDNKRLNGMGDLKLMLQYQLYNSEITSDTRLWQRIFLGGGFKLPTGVYSKTLTFGVIEPHFQPGTGSFDILLTGNHIAQLMQLGLGISNDIVYTINSENKNGYRFGNRFNLTSTLFYDITTGNFSLLPHGGVYYESAPADKLNGIVDANSGGKTLFGTGGLDVYYKEFSLDFTFQLPISENLNGDQPENRRRFYLGLGYAF